MSSLVGYGQSLFAALCRGWRCLHALERTKNASTRGLKVSGVTSEVAVAIATFNGAAYVEEAVDSALATGAPVVVSDDASDDETPDLLRRYGHDIDLHLHSTNVGIGGNYQFLLGACTRPLAMFLNQDDRIERPEIFRRSFAHDEVSMFNGWVIDESGHHQRLIYRRPPLHASLRGVYRALTGVNFTMGPSQAVFPVAAARRVGGFRVPAAEGQGAEDWLLWLRLASAGLRFKMHMQPTVGYRRHAGNYSHHAASHSASRAAVRRALPGPPDVDRRMRVRW